jgi:hypothetical protein
MRTLTTRRIATRDSAIATITRRPGTAARVIVRLVGATAVVTLALGVPASHARPTAALRHAVVADDMGPTVGMAQPIDGGAASA